MKYPTLSLERGKKYLLGLSGGADSVCLFHLLRGGGYDFSAAHINHGIRGEEADRDEAFCRELCEKHSVKLHLLRADVPAEAKAEGESLEEAARRVRYSFFEKVMREGSIDVLLTAHNADDNAETLILSLTRGCTLSGACGIAPARPLAFGEVQRPLLIYKKEEIICFCRENGFAFVTDSTNSDVSYPRNRVRRNILPELCEINPEFLSAFLRFTESARLDAEYLDAEAQKYADPLDCDTVASLPRPIAARAVALGAYRAGASPEAIHVSKMLEIAKAKCGAVTLPGSVIAEYSGGRMVFRADAREKASATYPDWREIALREGENTLPHGKLILVSGELTNTSAHVYNLSTSALINADKIKGQLHARPRREGDRILIGGMHRSVKKLISEKASHIGLSERHSLPVICSGDEIVWVPFLGVADGYRGNTLTLQYFLD
ncbi:MAG: tRNA lysidine(34) synthetase TilS [Clostridia bacterium]|nr:tRNA lysidine(34) synthetase TilS [Clostridia bacterium]